jgi:branched-chain amino acid transport system ATP-binding protein
MLEIKSISTYYGYVQALKEVSLEVREGEIVSIIGANGAGKSTLLNSISAITPPRSGQILLDGKDVTRLPVETIVGMGISQVPERRQVFSALSIYDNLLLGAYLRLSGGERAASVADDMEKIFALFPILKDRQKQMAGTLSGGEQQMLAIGRGMMARPKILLLDEPSLGLAPLLVKEIFRVLHQLREQGTTIVLVEQDARAALSLSDRAYVMETGRIELSGTSQELMANQDVKNAYLGRADRHPKRKEAPP